MHFKQISLDQDYIWRSSTKKIYNEVKEDVFDMSSVRNSTGCRAPAQVYSVCMWCII